VLRPHVLAYSKPRIKSIFASCLRFSSPILCTPQVSHLDPSRLPQRDALLRWTPFPGPRKALGKEWFAGWCFAGFLGQSQRNGGGLMAPVHGAARARRPEPAQVTATRLWAGCHQHAAVVTPRGAPRACSFPNRSTPRGFDIRGRCGGACDYTSRCNCRCLAEPLERPDSRSGKPPRT